MAPGCLIRPSSSLAYHSGCWVDQGRVDGGVVDHQVQHHLEAPAPGLFEKVDQGRLRVLAGLGIKEGIEAEVILDGIQAAGQAGGVDGVQKDPGEAHGRDAVQVLLPLGDGPGQGRKEIVDQGWFRHEITSLNTVGQWSVISGQYLTTDY